MQQRLAPLTVNEAPYPKRPRQVQHEVCGETGCAGPEDALKE